MEEKSAIEREKQFECFKSQTISIAQRNETKNTTQHIRKIKTEKSRRVKVNFEI